MVNYSSIIFFLAIICAPLVLAYEFPAGVVRLYDHYTTLAQNITFLVAFLAGIITFTSSCGFVVLPTFLSVVFKERKQARTMAIAFVIGLTIAFTLFGIIAGLLGNFFNPYKTTLAQLSGFLLLFFGILLLLNKGFSLFFFKTNHSPRKNFFSILSLGFFFAVGWTPCIGPVLSSMFLLAANTGTLSKSILFFIAYSAGIATPLLSIAYLTDKYDLANSSWIRGRLIEFTLFGKKIRTHTYNIIGSSFLIFLGTIMILYQGTVFFQSTIPTRIWSMNVFNTANQVLLEHSFFHSTIANALGVGIIIIFIILIIRHIIVRKI